MVSIFKDFLIMDDINEFLKRPYSFNEQKVRLTRFYDYYASYTSKIYPNYVSILPEAQPIFKNIQRKQRLLDEKEQRLEKQNKEGEDSGAKEGESQKPKEQPPSKLFDTKFINSVELFHNDISKDQKSFRLMSSNHDTNQADLNGALAVANNSVVN